MMQRNGELFGRASARRGDVELVLQPDPGQNAPGLAGITVETASGMSLARPRRRRPVGAPPRARRDRVGVDPARRASRGEAGILGEGIRQALLRDPTHAGARVRGSAGGLRPQVHVTGDLAGAAAERLAGVAGDVITGGSTPKAAYGQVAEQRPDWSGTRIWFSDERCAPPEHEHSNFGMAKAVLFDRIEGAEVHWMRGSPALPRRRGLRGRDARGVRPRAAGLRPDPPRPGPDVHTCSLFPGDDALGERERWAVGRGNPGMSPGVQDHVYPSRGERGRAILFLGDRRGQAEAVARAFDGPPTRALRPAWWSPYPGRSSRSVTSRRLRGCEGVGERASGGAPSRR